MPGVAVVTGAGRGIGREVARRLSGRGYTVLATDIDAEAAAATAEQVGGLLARARRPRPGGAPPGGRRRRSSGGRSRCGSTTPGVLRTQRAWEHDDAEVRLLCEVNLMGVIWGSRAAVDAMRGGPG